MKISLAVPVYNEENVIQEFLRQSIDTLLQISDDIEIVLVNDCSIDKTSHNIEELCANFPCIKLINLDRNYGQHIATAIALQNTTGDLIYMMDSDLQISPHYILDFYLFSDTIECWDIISASRIRRATSFSRRLGSYAVSFLLRKLFRSKLRDIGSTFKLIKRNALNLILSRDVLIQNLPIVMMSLNLKIIEREVEYSISGCRKSHYGGIKLINAISLALLNFSSGLSTLFILISIGIFAFSIGVALLIGIIAKGILYHAILPTNWLIFSLILILIGIQFFLMGIIALKIERINKNLDFRKVKYLNSHAKHNAL